MPCSCGNTICPCGIPCYCSEESCKCSDCGMALQRFCKVCNKPLITERQTDENTCSCFMGESTALTLENQEKPKHKLGSIPMPTGYFVSGKLVVNVMIPLPFVRFPHFIPQQPSSLMPPAPSIEENHSKISFISDDRVLKSVEDSVIPTTVEMNKFLSKSSGQSNDFNSSDYSSNSEGNTEILRQKIRPPPGFLRPADYDQTVNIVRNTKSETKDSAEVQEAEEMTTFYLPSIVINDISYPVGLRDPVWKLPISAIGIAGSPGPSLNFFNPFYGVRPVQETQNVATYEHEFNPLLPGPFYESNAMRGFTKNKEKNVQAESATYEHEFNPLPPGPFFESNAMRGFTENKERNVQAESAISLQMNEQTLDPTILSEQQNGVINDESVEFAVSSNNAAGNECAAPPSSGSFNAMSLSEQCGILADCLLPEQSQSLCDISTSESGNNYPLQEYPDVGNPANKISDNVYPEPTLEPWQNLDWCSPLPEIPVLTGSIPIQSRNLRNFQTSEFNSYPIPSFEENERFQTGNARSASANDNRNKENIPLYADPRTTQKMEKLLKPILKLNICSPILAENLNANNFSNFIPRV